MDSKKKMKISVVIPAYNEEESIAPTIMEIHQIFKNMKHKDYEIIIVNNNSKDRTAEIAKEMGAKVLFEPFQPGYGEAYKRGFRAAKGDIIITGDADSTYPFYDIPRFLKIMESKKADFMNTNRYSNLDKNSMPFINYIGNIMLTQITNVIYKSKLKDSQSGMWIFNRKFLESLNFDIMDKHMAFSQEIKLYALFLKDINFLEVPIRYRVRIGDKKLRPIKDGWDNFTRLIKFRSYLQMEQDKKNVGVTGKWNFIDNTLAKMRIGKIKKHIKKNSVLLDVGCGYDYTFLRGMKSHVKKGIGVDFQVKEIRSGKIDTYNVDFEKKKLQIKDKSIDCVTMIATIEHLNDPSMIMKEINRTLKKDGTIFITTPTIRAKPILEFLCFSGIVKNKDSLDHKIYYNRSSLVKLLRNSGFEIVKHKYFQFGLNQYLIARKI